MIEMCNSNKSDQLFVPNHILYIINAVLFSLKNLTFEKNINTFLRVTKKT